VATKRQYEYSYRRRSWWSKKQDSMRDTAQQVLWSLIIGAVIVIGLLYFSAQGY
jgi:hypothetical protein